MERGPKPFAIELQQLIEEHGVTRAEAHEALDECLTTIYGPSSCMTTGDLMTMLNRFDSQCEDAAQQTDIPHWLGDDLASLSLQVSNLMAELNRDDVVITLTGGE